MKSEYIEESRFRFLMEYMKPLNARALEVSLYTGFRVGDVVALRPDEIGADGSIQITAQKTGKIARGFVPLRLRTELLGGADSFWCFPSPYKAGEHLTRFAVYRDLKRAAKLCGIKENITPHSARKIFAVNEFRVKGLEKVMEELQHDRFETTSLYAFADLLTLEAARKRKESAPDENSNNQFDEVLNELREELQTYFRGVADAVNNAIEKLEEMRKDFDV